MAKNLTRMFHFILVFLIHLFFFISYPNNGYLGFAYVFIASILWTSFIILFNATLERFSKQTIYTINLIVYFVIIISILYIFPQKDGTAIIDKMAKGEYPNKINIYVGLKRLGIDYKPLIKDYVKEETK